MTDSTRVSDLTLGDMHDLVLHWSLSFVIGIAMLLFIVVIVAVIGDWWKRHRQ